MPTDPELAVLARGAGPSARGAPRAGTEWVPLDWALRRVRTHSLLAGLSGGGLVALALLALQPRAAPDPTPVAAPAAVAPPPRHEAAPVVERATIPRGPAVRRPAAAAPRATKDVPPARSRDSAEDGWFPVEEAVPGAAEEPRSDEVARGPEGLPGEIPAEPPGAATASEAVSAGEAASPDVASPAPPLDAPPGELAAGAAADPEPAGPPAEVGEAPGVGPAPDAYAVAAAFREHRAEIESCVAEADAATGATSEPPRRLRLVVVVDPSGQVSDARLDEEPGDATPLGACLLGIAREMTFAPFDGDPARVRLALSQAPR